MLLSYNSRGMNTELSHDCYLTFIFNISTIIPKIYLIDLFKLFWIYNRTVYKYVQQINEL